MAKFFNFRAAADETVLGINGEIGAGSAAAAAFRDQLGAVKGRSLSVEINSLGGDVFAGLAIFNMLRQSGKRINVRVTGIAASAASLVAMAGDTIEMPSNTFLMVHNPWSVTVGNAAELRENAATLDKIGAALVATYCKRTGMSEPRMRVMLSAETWLSADEALAERFCTSVSDPVDWDAPQARTDLPGRVRAAARTKAPTREVEITALCGVAKRPDLAAGFIANGASLADVRAKLHTGMQGAVAPPRGVHIDTTAVYRNRNQGKK
jgi:ATP-dependent protease ClpP protease subunit